MKLKLVAAISALAIPALAYARQGGPQPTVPKPTTADAQKVVELISSDKVKTQAYCDLNKLEGQVKAAEQKNDTKTLEALSKQAEALIDKLGPEYYKLMDGLEEVDPNQVKLRNLCPYFQSLIRDAPSKAFRGRAGRRAGPYWAIANVTPPSNKAVARPIRADLVM